MALNPFKEYEASDNLLSTSELLGDHHFEVRLFKNGEDLGLLQYQPDTVKTVLFNRPNFRKEISPAEVGDIFRMEVRHPDFPEVFAYQEIPAKVPLQRIEYLGLVGISDFEDPVDGYLPLYGLRITLDDPAMTNNYYQISIADFKLSPDSPSDNVMIPTQIHTLESDEPSLIPLTPIFNGSFYLGDLEFNGKQVSFVIKSTRPFTSDTRLVWRNISKEWFHYVVSIISQKPEYSIVDRDALLRGYFQPSSVEGNIVGGLGCFCAGTEELYVVPQ